MNEVLEMTWIDALFGLLIGSFLNVCIYRMPRDLSVVAPRSRCPNCDHPVSWYDNIPLVSYLLLRGRCRHCRWRIPWRYPLVELLTAAMFWLACTRWGPTPEAGKWIVFGSIMLVLVFADMETRILPDQFTIGGFWAGLALATIVPHEVGFFSMLSGIGPPLGSIGEALFAAGFASGSIWIVGVLYRRIRQREGLGFGDVKMLAAMGVFLGLSKTLMALILGSVAGSVLGLVYIYLTRKDASTYQLPFGTFLGAAAIAVAFFG